MRPSGASPPRRRRVVRAAQLDDLARRVLHDLLAGDEVGVAQAHLAAGREPEELLRRVLHEVLALDPELAREGHLARAGRGVLGVVDGVELLDLSLGVVLDHHLERAAAPPCAGARVRFSSSRTQCSSIAHVDDAVALGDADHARRSRGWPRPGSRAGGCPRWSACAGRPSRAPAPRSRAAAGCAWRARCR